MCIDFILLSAKSIDLHGDGNVNGSDKLFGFLSTPIKGLWVSCFGIPHQLASRRCLYVVRIGPLAQQTQPGGCMLHHLGHQHLNLQVIIGHLELLQPTETIMKKFTYKWPLGPSKSQYSSGSWCDMVCLLVMHGEESGLS